MERKPKPSSTSWQRLDVAMAGLEHSIGELRRLVALVVEARGGPPPADGEHPQEAEADADDELGGH